MMVSFWISAIICILVALAFVLPPFLRRKNIDDKQHQKMNVAIYNERLVEIKNSAMNEQEQQQAQTELEKNLSDDLGFDFNSQSNNRHGRWPVILLAILLPASALGGYYLNKQEGVFDPLAKQSRGGANSMMSMEEIKAKLEQRVAANPNNKTDVMMLARAYQAMGEYPKAKNLFVKLMNTEMAQEPDFLINYAETLAIMADRSLVGKPADLIKKTLSIDPKHMKGLWLAGMLAIENKQAAEALSHWQKLLVQLPPGSKDWQSVKQQLDEIQLIMAEKNPNAMTESPTEKPVAVATPVANDNTKVQLSVTVDIDAKLKAKMSSDAVVLIYARPATGAKMPLAMIQKSASELPVTVILDDSLAMMPQMKLSLFPDVVVIAKVSNKASAMVKSGDLLGQSDAINVAQQQDSVIVTINNIAP